VHSIEINKVKIGLNEQKPKESCKMNIFCSLLLSPDLAVWGLSDQFCTFCDNIRSLVVYVSTLEYYSVK